MIFLLDNYDSFTHNLAHLLARSGEEISVVRSDQIEVEDVLARNPRRIVISPGPGRPEDRGIGIALVLAAARAKIPVLGVCLGHQGLAQAFGGTVIQARRIVHGKASPVFHDGRGLFRGVPSPFLAMRYHSLVVDGSSLPRVFVVSAWLEDGTIMGIRHRERPLEGIQFHPESFLTPLGPCLIDNFLNEEMMVS
jgi:anthranilate synthase/aminodeoxychorismate synthase-like glutamine amidotransferase